MDKYQSYSCWLTLVFKDSDGWEGSHSTPTFEIMAVNKANAERIARSVAFIFDNLPCDANERDTKGVQIVVGDKVHTLVEHHVHVAAC